MPQTYLALDLETTGLDPDRDAIIEVAALRFDAGGIQDRFQSLVRPAVDISPRSQQLTGLSLADLADAPSIEAVLPALAAFAGDALPIGHSLGHDLRFLARRGLRFAHAGLDTFELATILMPDCGRYSLASLTARLGIAVEAPAHRALADAEAHRRLFLALRDRARRLPLDLLVQICALAEGQDWPAAELFRQALGDPLPAAPGMAPGRLDAPASHAGAALPLETIRPQFDAEALEGLIAPGGRLARRFEGFEDRPGQRSMLRQVSQTLGSGDQLLVEAGTGTGKSLAYLLPAAAMALARGRPVVVATHTIALQQQLMAKDIPLAAELIGLPLRSALLKGRANYLCRSRLAEQVALAEQGEPDRDTVRALVKLLVWARHTETGDRAELLLQPEERETWQRVSAAAGCSPEACSAAADGACWLQRARSRAATADLVITNHALLAADMRSGQALLPDFDQLVIDEAHHLEAVATEALGSALQRGDVERLLTELQGSQGSLARADRALRQAVPLGERDGAELGALAAELRGLAGMALPSVAALFVALEACFVALAGKAARELRLTPTVRGQGAWLAVETEWDRLQDRFLALDAGLAALGQGLREHGEDPAALAAAGALRASRRRIETLRSQLETTISRPEPAAITWLARFGPGRLTLHAAPMDVGASLAEGLFAGRAVVLTSATLRAGDDFAFIRERLCLPDAPAVTIDAPFDYASAVLLCTPRDLPAPGEPGHALAQAQVLNELARALGGRTLVLYTSHSGLKQAYHLLRKPLGDAGIAVIAQGIDGSRHQLLAAFRDPEAPTVLLGTRSFWEGIDIPGPALSALVIVRLPFDVPSDPVFQARGEAYDDPFGDYALPLGVLRFRQGAGRLIRSASDRGVLVLLDSRIHSKSYGPLFLESLPACRRFDGSAAELAPAAAAFLAARPASGA
ncbi:MAG: DEAD/DEAH box helicase family protein [Chloroflexi bacterium]|nr:DEAD/DEAH box helicase family protein [Chloroflexota bacterium]